MKPTAFLIIFAGLAHLPLVASARNSEPLPEGGFIENKTPFLRSALVFKVDKVPNRTRRGVLLPLGHGFWACFDPDLLRWSAVWKTEPGQPPISYDSMAAISFPDAKAKSTKPPDMQGHLVFYTPEIPGASIGQGIEIDPRKNFLTDKKTPVGPLPRNVGQWLGISLYGTTPVLHYRVGDATISDTIRANEDGSIQRCIKIGPTSSVLNFRLGSPSFKTSSNGATVRNGILQVGPSKTAQEIRLFNCPNAPQPELQIPEAQASTPIFPESLTVVHSAAKLDGPFSIRNIPIPEGGRVIRPTDIAFLSNGTALLATLDGDIWRVEGIDDNKSVWTRVATGLFEPMSITTTGDDRVFVLGRDQVTELIDTNGDGHIDIFRCASDAFLQTLHTRDYATSLKIDRDGSFLISKGGISEYGNGVSDEISQHRGTILRISPEKNSIGILADGLRLPYVGLRTDGTIFVSDQQGHYIPSTPIHRLGDDRPFLGFRATDFRTKKQPTAPLFYYPYQTNRSAAAFTTTSRKAFTDLADTFLQISWNGRLFGIATPDGGHAFSWQLPIQLDFPSLNGATHPKSGRLYVVGLGISGYKPSTTNLLGLASIEQTRSLPTPQNLKIDSDGIHVQLNRPLTSDEKIVPGNPALRAFNIKRTSKYGSGHNLWSGKPGEHHFQATSFTLSPDGSTLHLAFDQIRRSDVLDIHLVVSSGDMIVPLHLFSRPSHLPKANPADLAELANQEKNQPKLVQGDPKNGKQLFTQYSCSGCHSLADEKLTGPPLKGLATRSTGKEIRESILKPEAKVTEGYPPSMPSFNGVVSAQDLEDLIAFLMTLAN